MRKTLLIILAVFLPSACAFCDTVVLTNGNSIKGIIKNEDANGVELEIDIASRVRSSAGPWCRLSRRAARLNPGNSR